MWRFGLEDQAGCQPQVSYCAFDILDLWRAQHKQIYPSIYGFHSYFNVTYLLLSPCHGSNAPTSPCPTSVVDVIVVSQHFLTPLVPSVLSSRVSPFSLLPPPLLSLLSTGTKRSLEWKKYIRYPPCSHRPIIPTSLSKAPRNVIKKKQINWNAQFPLHCSDVRHLKMSAAQREHIFPTVDMVALPTLCPCDILLNLHLCRVLAVMAFSFLFCHALSYLSSLCTYLVVF